MKSTPQQLELPFYSALPCTACNGKGRWLGFTQWHICELCQGTGSQPLAAQEDLSNKGSF